MLPHDARAILVRAKVLLQNGSMKNDAKKLAAAIISGSDTWRVAETKDVRGLQLKATGERLG